MRDAAHLKRDMSAGSLYKGIQQSASVVNGEGILDIFGKILAKHNPEGTLPEKARNLRA